ncbi:MAG: cytochrome ubiquinol oxidase subunit I [Candidatus Micrarchaeota archaeon]|nr:cytochrome ubiquinol oxidase subunit I [Candidatus Micrarchaeota archaeon]
MLPIVVIDRVLFGFSLAIHIILAAIGITLPAVVLTAEFIGIKYRDTDYTVFAKRLATAFAIFFAVGAASGTIVGIGFVLLWPKFMSLLSQVAILPLYVETFVFFFESLFLATYLYSWDRFKNKYLHILLGIPIAIAAPLSGSLITMVNAFMNVPVGFNIHAYLTSGIVTGVQPFAVFFSPAALVEVSHVVSTSYFFGIFILIAYAAYRLLGERDRSRRRYYKKVLGLVFVLGIIATIAAVATGLLSIDWMYHYQPEKFAALEANLYSQAYAPERLFGIPANGTVQYSINIPDLQSLLASGSLSGVVPGLINYPQNTWPPLIIHDLFDLMVFVGFGVAGFLALIVLLYLLKRNPFENRWILILLIVSGVFALINLEAGWVTAELGRQPWIIYNVMLVSEAANYSLSVIPGAILILLFYIFIIPFTLLALRRIFRNRQLDKEISVRE